ncbi:MAG: hypothetical protein KGI33_01240 [Thaumarchaeota archaeon]|nr:hypothetical protein [Nitrososphaerota archaeon]
MPRGQRQFFKLAMNIVLKEKRPFSKMDFPCLTNANYRRYIHKIRRYLEPVGNTKPKFWTIKGMPLPGDSHRITLDHTGVVGQKFFDLLESIKLQHPTIHDIKVKFTSDLHKHLAEMGCSCNPANNSIKVGFETSDNNLHIKILVYPETTQIDIGCTYKPIVHDLRGILYLSEIFSKVSHHLSSLTGHIAAIPPVHEWVITHYHFAKDGTGIPSFNGQTFHMTFEEVAGGLIRFYSKRMPDGLTIPRLEQIKSVQETLDQKMQEVLEVTS